MKEIANKQQQQNTSLKLQVMKTVYKMEEQNIC